jgi:hypothetical protein
MGFSGSTQHAEVEASVVGGDHAPRYRLLNMRHHVNEQRRVENLVVQDAVYTSCLHRTNRPNKRIKHSQPWSAWLDPNDSDL